MYDKSIIQTDKIEKVAKGYHTDIKFTVENEKENCLPFLDVIIERSHRKLSFRAYKKDCYVDVLLNYNSLVPEYVKYNIFKSSLDKIYKRTAEWIWQQNEYKELIQSMLNNGYPIKKLEIWYQRWNKKDVIYQVNKEEEKNKYRKILQIPFVQPMFSKIKNVFKNLDVRIVFENNSTIRNWLENYKYSTIVEKINNVVYQIECECGGVYIGETGRTLQQRTKEHRADIRLVKENSAVVDHVMENNRCAMKWEQVKVLEKERHWRTRRIIEHLYIKK